MSCRSCGLPGHNAASCGTPKAGKHVGEYKRKPRERVTVRTKVQQFSLKQLRAWAAEIPVEEYDRPTRRSDCLAGGINAQRPCPFVSCRHHLALDVNPESGKITLIRPDREIWELEQSCSLDVADAHGEDGMTLVEVGKLTNVTNEWARRLEMNGLRRLAERFLGENLMTKGSI